jgi:hypothetical protein
VQSLPERDAEPEHEEREGEPETPPRELPPTPVLPAVAPFDRRRRPHGP